MRHPIKQKLRYLSLSLACLFSSSSFAVTSDQICQTDSLPATTPTSRFVDNHDGTVTDTKTQLMWKKCAEGLGGNDCSQGTIQSYSWTLALLQAQTMNNHGGFAGFSDWRLPSLKELHSIVERQCHSPAINLAVFPNTELGAAYWSSTPVADDNFAAWVVYFEYGRDSLDYKPSSLMLRLVRDISQPVAN